MGEEKTYGVSLDKKDKNIVLVEDSEDKDKDKPTLKKSDKKFKYLD